MTSTELAAPRLLAYDRWMAAAEVEYDRILGLLRGVPADRWAGPTDCAGWSVRDVVAHLAGAAAATASPRELVRQAWHGRRLGRRGDLVDRMNEVQIAERQSLPPAALLADLAAAGRRGVGTRRRIPGPVRGVRLPLGSPLGVRPLGYLTGRIYTRDAWMHRVDLARATGAPLELTAEHDGAIVEDIVAEWAAVHGHPYELRLSGPAGGAWCGSPGEPAEDVRLDAVDFARTVSGRVAGAGLLSCRVPF
jgi:uncharacterized protein (TIGR03083 family)